MYYVIRRSKTGPHMSSYDLLAVPEDTRIPKAAWKFGAAGIEVVFSSPYREKVVQYQRGMLGADIREVARQMLLDEEIDVAEYLRLVG
jgi:hypothetical protein